MSDPSLHSLIVQDKTSASDRMLALIRSEFPGYHPVVSIARIAHSTGDERIELDCHKTIASFITPTLRAVEVRAQVETQRRVIVELFEPSMIPIAQKEAINLADIMDITSRAVVNTVISDEVHDPLSAWNTPVIIGREGYPRD